MKLKPQTLETVWAAYFGAESRSGGGGDSITGLAADTAGNVYLAGTTLSAEFP